MSKELAEKLSATDLQNVDVTDPQAIADMLGYGQTASTGDQGTTQGDTTSAPVTGAPAAPAPVAAPVDSSAPPAAAATPTSEIAGVLTKDGKHVIPHRVLSDARTEASMAKQRATELEQQNQALAKQLEDLKAGRTPEAPAAGELTEERVRQFEEDFPTEGAVMRTAFEQIKALKAVAPQPAPAPRPEEVAQQEVSRAEALDQALAPRPLLTQYREAGGVVWARAVEIDAQLLQDAAFAGQPIATRLEEVEKRLAAELGVQLSTPKTPAPPPPTQIMPTLTDLSGSGVAVGDPLQGMTKGQMVDKAMSMDMEQLRRMAGLSY